MCFFIFKMFLCFLTSCFVVVVVETKNVQNYKYDAKTPFPGQSECFVAVLLTLFDSY